MNNSSDKNNNKPVVEFSARITLPDGRVIEKTVSTTGDFPSPEDFDLSTREGFLADFDALERAVLEARNKIGEEISNEFLKDSSKKNSTKHKN